MNQRIYGIHPVKEAILGKARPVKEIHFHKHSQNRRVKELVRLARIERIHVIPVEKTFLDRLMGTKDHQGIVADVGSFPYRSLSDLLEHNHNKKSLFLIIDSITDPHNLGALLRTACACGVDGVVLPSRKGALITPTVAKTSAGACEHIPIAMVNNLVSAIDLMKKKGIWIIGTDESAETSIYQISYDLDLAFVIGSEGTGMRSLVKRRCDFVVSIPSRGKIRTLNASVTGGVILYEILRQRRFSE